VRAGANRSAGRGVYLLVTDQELVEHARRGDDEAWAELVRRHGPAVYRTAFAALLREDEADDAAQEAWVAAWTRLDGFRQHASVRTWLLAIAWRKALNRRRAVSRLWRRLTPASADDDGVPAAERVGDSRGRSPERDAIEKAERRHVAQAMRTLPTSHRDCLMLAAAGELTYAEIAALLGIAEGTVKWRVSEARKRLRERLERQGS